jgi:hypothetical protein
MTKDALATLFTSPRDGEDARLARRSLGEGGRAGEVDASVRLPIFRFLLYRANISLKATSVTSSIGANAKIGRGIRAQKFLSVFFFQKFNIPVSLNQNPISIKKIQNRPNTT